jgi:hypothetical protein
MDYFPMNWGKPLASPGEEHNWLSTPNSGLKQPSTYDFVHQIQHASNPIQQTQ